MGKLKIKLLLFVFSMSLDYKEEQDGEVEALKSIYTEEEFKGESFLILDKMEVWVFKAGLHSVHNVTFDVASEWGVTSK